jgi:hypothetical protein
MEIVVLWRREPERVEEKPPASAADDELSPLQDGRLLA